MSPLTIPPIIKPRKVAPKKRTKKKPPVLTLLGQLKKKIVARISKISGNGLHFLGGGGFSSSYNIIFSPTFRILDRAPLSYWSINHPATKIFFRHTGIRQTAHELTLPKIFLISSNRSCEMLIVRLLGFVFCFRLSLKAGDFRSWFSKISSLAVYILHIHTGPFFL